MRLQCLFHTLKFTIYVKQAGAKVGNEAEAYASGTKAAAEKPVEVRAHARKRQSGNVLDVVPEGTRTEVVEHRLPENERICSACGSELVEIGKDVRRTLQMKPAEFWVREDVYYTYACKNCEQETGEANIVKACLLYTSRCV